MRPVAGLLTTGDPNSGGNRGVRNTTSDEVGIPCRSIASDEAGIPCIFHI